VRFKTDEIRGKPTCQKLYNGKEIGDQRLLAKKHLSPSGDPEGRQNFKQFCACNTGDRVQAVSDW